MSDVQSITIPLTAITISPLHHRTVWDAPGQTLAQLGDSMADGGQIEEIRVRITEPGQYELIDGARRFKAAGLAGLKTLRAIVEVNVGDDELLRRQLIHASGVPLHPMDEAMILDTLANKCGLTLAAIVEFTGIDADQVRRRLKLAGLTPKGRKLYAGGEIDDLVAFAASRIASPKLQDEALAQVIGKDKWGNVLSQWAALSLLRRLATRHLSLAVWPTGETFADKRACEGCPDRTLAQMPLFNDMHEDRNGKKTKDADDYCANLPCWDAKLAEARTRAIAKAKAGAVLVLGKPEVAKTFGANEPQDGKLRSLVHRSGYVDADEKPAEWVAGPKKTPRELGVPIRALAIDPDGHPRWLCDEKVAEGEKRKATKATKRAKPEPVSPADKREQTKRKAERAKEVEAEAVETALVAAVESAARKANPDRLIEVLLRLFLSGDQYRADQIAERRATSTGAILKQLDAKGKPEDRRALFALVLFDDAIEQSYGKERRELIVTHAKLLGVDVAVVTKAAIKAHAAMLAIEKESAKATAASKAKGAKAAKAAAK